MAFIGRKNALLIILFCFSMFFIAKVAKGQYAEGYKLFKTIERPANLQKDTFADHTSFFSLNTKNLKQLWSEKPGAFEIAIPKSEGDDILVELERNQILTADFEVRTSSNKEVDYKKGVYYTGSLKGNRNSHATLSVFQDQVMGVLATDTGNLVLGALKDEKGTPQTDYALYNDRNIKTIPDFNCKVEGNPSSKPNPQNSIPDQAGNDPDHSNKCISVYFECDYEMYKDNGNSVNNTVNFTTGVFNEVAKLYEDAAINVNISEVFVWDSSSPYSEDTSSADYLESFKEYRNNQGGFNGDLGHLISTTSANLGGRGYLNVLCGNRQFAYGFSNIYDDFETYPSYSWSVNVISHELGHNIGSRHTHRCDYWTTPNQLAIDSCSDLENGPCNTINGIPSGGGTIMSYCHTLSTGVDFTKGFGPYPRDTLQHYVNEASCIDACFCRDTISPKTCNQYTLPSGDDTLAASGIYFDTVSKAGDCDSILTVNLTILDTFRISETTTACGSYTWPINNQTYTESGNYVDTLSNGFGCDSIANLDLTVNKINTEITRNDSTLTVAATNADYKWLWCDSNFKPISEDTTQSFKAAKNGNYAVEVTKNGCKDTSECFTLENLGVVVNEFGQSFQVYPNPTSAKVTVNLGKTYKGASVTVKNALGKTINRRELSNKRIFDLHISGKSGLYFIEIKTANHKRARVKLLKTQ